MMVPADLLDAVRSHRSEPEAGGALASSYPPAKAEAVTGGLQEENDSNDTMAAAEARRKRSVSRSQPTAASLRELEGWLTKQGSHWRTWRERWFRLSATTGELHYYKLMHDTVPLGSISLKGASLVIDDSKFWRGTYGWVINVEQPKRREFLICTKHKHIRDEWTSAILALINYNTAADQPSSSESSLTSSSSLSFLSTSLSYLNLKGLDNSGSAEAGDSSGLSVEETITETPGSPDASTAHWKRALYIAPYKHEDNAFSSTPETTTRRFVEDSMLDMQLGLMEPHGVLGLNSTKAGGPIPVLADISDGYLAYAQLDLKGIDYVNHNYTLIQKVRGAQERNLKADNERREREREREEKRMESGGDHDEDDGEPDSHVSSTSVQTSAYPRVMKRVLFSGTEGWVQSVVTKNSGHMRIAANSLEEICQWTRHLLSPPASSETKNANRSSVVNGFLWFGREKEKSWERFYCVSDGTRLELYKLKNLEIVDLNTIRKIETSLVIQGVSRKGTFGRRELLVDVRQYNYTVNVHTDSGENEKKLAFMAQDEEQASFWKSALENFATSKVDTAKTVSILRKSIEGMKKQTCEESLSRSGERLMRSSSELGASASTPQAHRSPQLTRAASDLMPLSSSAAATVARAASSLDSQIKHYLQSEAAVQSGVFIQTHLDRITNLTRRLCEDGDEQTGKSPLGNYQVKKKVDAGDGHYRILSLDGGGLRAIMETVILSRLLEVFPDLLQRVDLIAGVSGGAMVGAGLAIGRSPKFICEMLKSFSPHFFKPKTRSTVQGLALNQAKYAKEPLTVFGDEIFKNISVRDVPKRILVASFLLDNEDEDDRSWEPRIYHNIPLKPDQTISTEEELSMPLWHAVMGSAAAPTFFPSFNKHVDGACMVNNPSLLALTMTMSEQALEPVEASRIHLLSLGTGHLRQFIGGDDHDWGVLQWAPKLPELLVAGGLSSQLHMVKMLLGNRFHQLNPTMEKFMPMDDHTIANDLIDLAMKTDLTETIEWISEHFYNIKKKSTEEATTASEEAKAQPRVNREKRRGLRISRVGPPGGEDGEFRCDTSAWYNSTILGKE